MKKHTQVNLFPFYVRPSVAPHQPAQRLLGMFSIALVMALIFPTLPVAASVDAGSRCEDGTCVMLIAATDNATAPDFTTDFLDRGDLLVPHTGALSGGTAGTKAMGGAVGGGVASVRAAASINLSSLFLAIVVGVLLLAAFNTRKRRHRCAAAELSRR